MWADKANNKCFGQGLTKNKENETKRGHKRNESLNTILIELEGIKVHRFTA